MNMSPSGKVPEHSRQRVLLVHPVGELFVEGGSSKITRLANVMPPHGLLTLASYLRGAGHEVKIADCFATPLSADEIVRQATGWGCSAVGFSCTTNNFLPGYAIAARLKAAAPDIATVFGGVHPTSIWRQLLEDYPHIDFIVVGEGEESLLELTSSGFDKTASVPGIASRDGEEISFGGVRPTIKDLDILPFPDYGLLEGFPERYVMPLFNYPRGPGTTFITSRGCPYSCAYCDRSVFGNTFRYHSADYLIAQLEFLNKTYGVRHVGIYDDNFLLHRERLIEFLEKFMTSGLRMTFNCIGSPHRLDPEVLRLLSRAGCWMVNIGVESGDENVISAFRTHHSLDRVRQAVADLKAAGIRAKGLFMMGIPGESESSIDKTIEMAVKTPFDDVNCTKFTPFPGTPIYKDIAEYGEFDEDWNLMNCLNFVFIPNGFTKERLEERYRQFYQKFYGRPSMGWNYFTMTWKSPDSWRRLIRNLPDFLAAKKALAK